MNATKIKIPKPSANVEEVTLTGWHKQEGEPVAKGEPLVELTTDKAVFDLESPTAGLVLKRLAPEKSILPVGYIIALVGPGDATMPDVTAWNQKRRAALHDDAGVHGVPKPIATTNSDTVRATPAARRLAREKNLDLMAIARELGKPLINEKTLTAWLAAQLSREAQSDPSP